MTNKVLLGVILCMHNQATFLARQLQGASGPLLTWPAGWVAGLWPCTGTWPSQGSVLWGWFLAGELWEPQWGYDVRGSELWWAYLVRGRFSRGQGRGRKEAGGASAASARFLPLV